MLLSLSLTCRGGCSSPMGVGASLDDHDDEDDDDDVEEGDEEQQV